jgi:hypothetical protein
MLGLDDACREFPVETGLGAGSGCSIVLQTRSLLGVLFFLSLGVEAPERDLALGLVTNTLDAPTTVHWHGLFVPNGMDGVGGLTQRPIEPGETFRYEFSFPHAGTFMYHPHYDEMTQMAMG